MKKPSADKVLGVKIDFGLGMSNVLSIIESIVKKEKGPNLICTTNAEFILDAQEDKEFKSIINNSRLSLPDGIGVLFSKYYLDKTRDISNPIIKFIWGIWIGISSIFGCHDLGEKISGVDLAMEIMRLSHEKGYSIFLLGGWPKNYWGKPIKPAPFDLSERAAEKVYERYPNVNIIGTSSKFSRDTRDDEDTIAYIKKCMKEHGIGRLDFLLVAYNHIYQEKWFLRNASKIPANIGIGLGGTFDYLAGYLKRPRSYMFEWLKKLVFQPWRFSRIFRVFPLFPIKVFIDSIRK